MKSLDSSASKKADGKAEGAQTAGDNNGFFTPNSKIDFSNVKIEPLFEEAVDFDTFSKSDFRAVKVKECVAVPKSKKLLQFTLDDGTGTDRTILSGIHAYYEPEELVGKILIAITNLPPQSHDGHWVLWYAAVRSMRGERRREAEPAHGGQPYSGRREAVLREK